MNRPSRTLVAAAALLAAALGARGGEVPLVPFSQGALTHGPILGSVTAGSVRVWVRTRRPGSFLVRFSERADLRESRAVSGTTSLERDHTGWVELSGLQPDTRYHYAIEAEGRLIDTRLQGRFNSFRTLPAAEAFRHPVHNPAGRFNFQFEFGCGNNQNPAGGHSTDPPAYATMLRELKDRIHFQVMNGDWLYEELRDTPAEHWARDHGVTAVPPLLSLARGISGVWENYRLYLSRSPNLTRWHREVPFVVTFDDHEILNDVYGCGHVGLRTDARRPEAQGPPGRESHEGLVERAVFRDPALQAWRDYLGWANPDIGNSGPIRFGRARLEQGSDILTDPAADFTRLEPGRFSNLHVQWGYGNSGVYEVVGAVDRTRLRIRPAAAVTEEAAYSIGAHHHTRFRVSNCEFFLLDTRSYRTLHHSERPRDPRTSMLGRAQREWLKRSMRESDADFFFVVSSVNFMIPHVSGGQVEVRNKDDAWTAHVAERDALIDHFRSLRKPVFILTGDLHNCFVVKIAPGVWEFASGAHNSNSHWTSDAGGAPPSGPFNSRGRRVDVRWSTGYLSDVPRTRLHLPNYCVVQVSNAYNSPDAQGRARWIAYPHPQVTFRYHDGLTGALKYAESVSTLDARAR